MLASLAMCLIAAGPAQLNVYPSAGPAPETLVVLDLRHRTNYPERLLAASAQGLLNSQPRRTEKVYLILKDADLFWLDWLGARRYIRSHRSIATLRDLIELLPSRNALIYEDAPSHSGNIATAVAGCERLLIASTPEMVERYGLLVKLDLRRKWENNAEAYQWLMDRYKSTLAKDVVSITVPFATKTHDHPAQLRDYLIANRVFTFWLSGDQEAKLPGANHANEWVLLRDVLTKQFNDNIPCLGYPWSGDGFGPGEWAGVGFLSSVGKYLVPTDNFANLSVWSSFRRSSSRFKPRVEVPPLEDGKRYAAFVMSDGDNLCTWYDFFPGYWSKLKDTSAPIGWTAGPTLGDLAPPIHDYMVEHLPAGHSMGAGVSGIGYIAAEEYGKSYGQDRQRVVSRFMDLTAQTCRASGIEWLWVMRYGGPGSEWIRRYASIPGIKAVMGGYTRATDDPDRSIERVGETGVFHCLLAAGNPEEFRRELDRVLALPNAPRFLHLFILNWNFPPNELEAAAAYARSKGLTIVAPEALGELLPKGEGP